MYDVHGYFFSDGGVLCIECAVTEILKVGSEAMVYQPRMASHSGRAITVHNRKAVAKTLHDHDVWPSLYGTLNTYTRGQQRNDARAYAAKYNYTYPTLRTVVETALSDGKLWDKYGEPPSGLTDNEEWFDDRQCDECNKSLGLHVTCVRDNPERQGMEQCYCEDCQGKEVEGKWSPGNPIVTDATVFWIGRDLKLHMHTTGHDEDKQYTRATVPHRWMTKERLAGFHRMCWMSPELGLYVTIPWEKGERPVILRHVEYQGDWTEEPEREWDGEERRLA